MMPEPRHDVLPGLPPALVPGDERPTAGSAPAGLFAWYAPGFSDALGDRLLLFDNTDGRPLELLRLRPDFARAEAFEPALRERAAELAGFVDPHYARVCRVDRLPDPGGGLAVVSEQVEGRRLSDLLVLVRQRRARLTADTALALVTDLVAGVAALHARGRDFAHGTLGPERLVVTAARRILITEYVLGLAMRSVALDPAAAWREMRIALPPLDHVALLRLDQRTDVLQVGLTTLALLLARPLAADDYPGALLRLLAEAEERARLGGWSGDRWTRFRPWLTRCLWLENEVPFENAIEAKRVLEEVLQPERIAESARGEWALDLLDAAPPAPAPVPTPAAAVPSLEAAPPETDRVVPRQRLSRGVTPRRGPRQLVVALLSLIVVMEGIYIAGRFATGTAAGATTGGLRVESHPPLASVTVDGKPAGNTPVVLQLPVGRHQLELALGGRRRVVTVGVEAGTTVSQYLELPPAAAGAGQINVRSEPPGAKVLVDGEPRGVTPIAVTGLPLGQHEVRVENWGRSVVQAVTVVDAQAALVFVPFPLRQAPTPGWLTVVAPVELQVFEDAELVGTSRSERIMLTSGRHEISLVNEAVGFRESREIVVPVGQTTELEIAVPKGTLDINAAPWAEVWIDGVRVGETPLAAVPVTLGHHSVTFKHPTLGERTLDCLVRLRQPARLSTDLRK